MSNALSGAVLSAVRAGLPETATVYDGEVRLAADQRIIADQIPYVVFYTMPGDTVSYRLSGRSRRRWTEFQLTSVGTSREQAQKTADRARAAVEGTRLLGGLCRFADGDYVRPDPDARTTDDQAVFYAVCRFTVSN